MSNLAKSCLVISPLFNLIFRICECKVGGNIFFRNLFSHVQQLFKIILIDPDVCAIFTKEISERKRETQGKILEMKTSWYLAYFVTMRYHALSKMLFLNASPLFVVICTSFERCKNNMEIFPPQRYIIHNIYIYTLYAKLLSKITSVGYTNCEYCTEKIFQ